MRSYTVVQNKITRGSVITNIDEKPDLFPAERLEAIDVYRQANVTI